MKKFLALALASVMAVSLVACGSTNADTNAESSAAATTTAATAATAATAESSSEEPGLKIAIVSSPSGVDDGSFNQDNYNGVLKLLYAVVSSLQVSAIWHRRIRIPSSS